MIPNTLANISRMYLASVPVFTPADLFANGETGAWFDASDLTSMRQGRTGITAAAVGSPVGYCIDKSKGGLNAIGPELVSNGTFDTDTTGWTAEAGAALAVVDGTLEIFKESSGSSFPRAFQNITCVVGKTYSVSCRMRTGTSPVGAAITVQNTGGVVIASPAPPPVTDATFATRTVFFVATETTARIVLTINNEPELNRTVYFDDVSVREVPGNHAVAQFDSVRPILAQNPFRLDHDHVDDMLRVTLPDLGTNATVATLVGNTWTIVPNQTIGAGLRNLPTYDYRGHIIIDRALTAGEIAALNVWAGGEPALIPALDSVTATSVAPFSTRKLRSAYNGPAMRVRRSSDNVEADIGFTPAGLLDTTALTSHCGAGSGFVTIWYNQDDNAAFDAVQATAASQPRIVNNGVIDNIAGVPALFFDGVNHFMMIGDIVQGANSSMSVSTVLEVVAHKAGTADNHIFTNSLFGAELSLRYRPGVGIRTTTGFGQSGTALPVGTPEIIMYRGQGGSQSIRLDGAVVFTNTYAASAEQTAAYGIGGHNSGTSGRANMKLSEIIVWNSVLSNQDTTAIEASQAALYGVTLP